MSIPTTLITNELFQELTGLAFLVNSQGFIIKANRQSYHLLNYMEGDVIGRHIADIIKHPDIDRIMDMSETILSTERFEEMSISSQDGIEIPFKITVIPLRIKTGFQIGFLVIGEDIRALVNQRKTEVMLKQNNERINKLNDELVEMNKRLIQKSNRDSLTNLYNHQYINRILEEFLELEQTEAGDICVMMLDIDFFKHVNDSYGHLTGDKILIMICDIIKNCTRSNDYIGRYGGEEFLVVIPNINPEDAVLCAERIRSSVEAYDFGIEGLTVTISIGLARYSGETSKDLVNKADKLLYQAKSKGRNRYETELELEVS
jgi:diguanylate cyclase (GGDEF)-like protein/PAS domain S-box-containing protein